MRLCFSLGGPNMADIQNRSGYDCLFSRAEWRTR
jgi:hypothetical protein